MAILHNALLPLDDPLRWFVSRMLLFGAVIAAGMVTYVGVETVVHFSRPDADPITTGAPPKIVPLEKPKLQPTTPQPTPKPSTASGALIAKANDIFVGTPIYDKDGVTVVGAIRGIQLGPQGEISSFDLEWYDRGPESQTVRVEPSEIDWGGNNQAISSGQWAYTSLGGASQLKGILKDQSRLSPTGAMQGSQPPQKKQSN